MEGPWIPIHTHTHTRRTHARTHTPSLISRQHVNNEPTWQQGCTHPDLRTHASNESRSGPGLGSAQLGSDLHGSNITVFILKTTQEASGRTSHLSPPLNPFIPTSRVAPRLDSNDKTAICHQSLNPFCPNICPESSTLFNLPLIRYMDEWHTLNVICATVTLDGFIFSFIYMYIYLFIYIYIFQNVSNDDIWRRAANSKPCLRCCCVYVYDFAKEKNFNVIGTERSIQIRSKKERKKERKKKTYLNISSPKYHRIDWMLLYC